MIIDLRSDTVTQPSKAMLNAVLNAPLGDDVFNEDPTVNQLEETVAQLFGKEAALFCPSGTMTNQIAIKTHTQPLDEVICDKLSHIYKYETGGWAHHSGVSIKLVNGDRGRFTPDDITQNIHPDFDWLPRTKLVVAENTVNAAGGSIYSLHQLKQLSETCKAHQLKFHIDGARIFNAIVESNYNAKDIGNLADSISVCFSKGLGAPVGSALVGDTAFIKQARRIRKVMGGGMRQAGILAAAALFALENNIDRLKEDHTKAQQIGAVLSECTYVDEVYSPDTNILIFNLKETMSGSDFIQKLAEQNIKAIAFGPQQIRFVTHLNFTDAMCEQVIKVFKQL